MNKPTFDIAISTINREKKQYLFEMLTSLLCSTLQNVRINLIVGNPETSYLDNLRHNTRINIVGISDAEWSLVEHKGTCDKFNLNFYRCLTKVKLSSNSLGLVYLEDDIIFKDGWNFEMLDIIEMLQTKMDNFALSLYTPYDLSHNAEKVVYFDKGFYGTQGVFFTAGMIEAFAQNVMEKGVQTYHHMADILLQEFCNTTNTPLFSVKNSLLQHIGQETAINGNYFHKATNFLK